MSELKLSLTNLPKSGDSSHDPIGIGSTVKSLSQKSGGRSPLSSPKSVDSRGSYLTPGPGILILLIVCVQENALLAWHSHEPQSNEQERTLPTKVVLCLQLQSIHSAEQSASRLLPVS